MANITMNSTLINITELIAPNSTNHNVTINNTNLAQNATTPPAKIIPPPDPHYRSQATIIIQVALLATLGVIIVLGNLASIVTFLKTPSLRRRCHYLLISLSFADFLVGVNDFMTMYFFLTGPQFNLFIVSLEFIDTFTGTASILTLSVIAVERFYAIYFPFRHRMLRFKFYKACTAFPWVEALIIASLYVISYFGKLNNVYVAYTYHVFIIAWLALIVILSSYICIGLKMRQNNPSAQNQNRTSRERKLAVTLLIVTLASLLTWIPQQCFLFVLYLCKTCPFPHFNILFIMKFLQFSNSGINVFIYIIRMPEFRQAFLALLCNREQGGERESTKSETLSSVRRSTYMDENKSKSVIQKNQNKPSAHAQSGADPTLNSRSNLKKDISQNQHNIVNSVKKEEPLNELTSQKNSDNKNNVSSSDFKNGVTNVGFTDINDTKF